MPLRDEVSVQASNTRDLTLNPVSCHSLKRYNRIKIKIQSKWGLRVVELSKQLPQKLFIIRDKVYLPKIFRGIEQRKRLKLGKYE